MLSEGDVDPGYRAGDGRPLRGPMRGAGSLSAARRPLWAQPHAVLGLLMARGLAGPRWLSITIPYVVGAVVLAALYGVSDECHQLFVPGRQFDVRDMMANALGASVPTGALWAWGIIKRYPGGRGKPRLSR